MSQANGISRIEPDASLRLQEFVALTKPRVVSLIVFTAVIACSSPRRVWCRCGPVVRRDGIALVAGAAAAVNCLLEQRSTR